MKYCSAENCGKEHRARGYCVKHYAEARAAGLLPTPTMEDRFWAKVEPTGFCWLWTVRCNKAGYGTFKRANKSELAHRVAYELLVGPIPGGLPLDHLCRIHNCVNPDHLDPITQLENTRRGFGYGSRQSCPQKHPYTTENTIVERTGYRRCKTCHKKRQADWQRRNPRKRLEAA